MEKPYSAEASPRGRQRFGNIASSSSTLMGSLRITPHACCFKGQRLQQLQVLLLD